MTIVTIKERIMMIRRVENRAVHFGFLWQRPKTKKKTCPLKNTVGSAPALNKQLR